MGDGVMLTLLAGLNITQQLFKAHFMACNSVKPK